MIDDSGLVSVLMPAFKPEFLREAMASVLNQSHADLELLIGDNSGDPAIAAIIDEMADPRVVHVPSHRVSAGSVAINHQLLWMRARGRYVRYVYDDDVVYRRSTEVLLGLLRAHPGCAMAWHQRDVIDEASRVRERSGLLTGTAPVLMDRATVVARLAEHMNFIGEPSFVMFDRARHPVFGFNRYAGLELRFLWDVAAWLDATRDGDAIGSPEFLGGFRRHGAQISAGANPNHVFGCVEWELVFRHELCAGRLTPAQAEAAMPRVLRIYLGGLSRAPVLGAFHDRLRTDLRDHRLAEGLPAFLEAYRELQRARPR